MKTVFKYMKLSSTAGTRNMTTNSECQTVKLFPTIRISKTIPFRPKTPSSNYIGADKAKSIALKDAGLSSSSVTFTKAKLDREDGVRVYEIEFFTSDKEYEYEINASSGKIRDKDVEFNDDFDEEWDD